MPVILALEKTSAGELHGFEATWAAQSQPGVWNNTLHTKNYMIITIIIIIVVVTFN